MVRCQLFRLSIIAVTLMHLATAALAATQYRLRIPEIACSQCTARIERAIAELDGVQSIRSDVRSQTVTVEMVPGHRLEREAVEKAIGAMGFSLQEFMVDGDAAPVER